MWSGLGAVRSRPAAALRAALAPARRRPAPPHAAPASTNTALFRARQRPAHLALAPEALQLQASSFVEQALEAALQSRREDCLSSVRNLTKLGCVSSVREALGARQGEEQRTLLEALASRGMAKPLQELVEFAAPFRPGTIGLPLHLAAMGNHKAALKVLLQRGRLNVDGRDEMARTPLHFAVAAGARGCAKELAYFGANIGALDSDCQTPLDGAKAEAKGLVEWLKAFAKKRSDISVLMHEQGPHWSVKALGATLPAHIKAPELKLTPIGYCPVDENGNVKQLERGIRFKKRRKGPSHPVNNKPNWTCIRY